MAARSRAWIASRRPLLRWLLAGTALPWVLYLLSANLFLNTALADRAINRKPERFQMQWSWALSLYPGHVYVRGVALGGHGRAAAWAVQGASAHGRIRLLPLLRRELRFAPIHAREVTLRTDRGGRDPAAGPPAPVPGKQPWTLRLDAIGTDSLQRLQFDDWWIEGGGEASFGLVKTLRGGTLEVLPSTLRMPQARAGHGDTVVLDTGSIAMDLALPPHLPTQVRGMRKLGIADARVAMKGRVPGLRLREDAQGKLSWGFDGERGELDASLALQGGALTPGGRLRLSVPLQAAEEGRPTLDYALQVQADVEADGVALHAQVPQQTGRRDRLDAQLRIGSRAIDPEQAPRAWLGDLSGRVQLQWRFGSLRWIDPLLSEQRWLRMQGSAEVGADLRIDQGTLVSGSSAQVREADLRAEVLDNLFQGSAHLDAQVEGAADARRLRMTIVADRFAIAPLASPQQVYVRGRNLRLDLDGDGDLAAFRRTLQARLRFSDAQIPDLRAYNRNLPQTSLRLLGGSGRIGGDLQIDAAGEVVHGEVQLVGRDADIRFGASRLVGNLQLDSRLRRLAPGARDYRLERLDLQLDGVRLAGANDPPWWARLDLAGAQLDWRPPFALRSDLRLRLKDASLLLSLFAERRAFPRWIGRVIDEGEVRATARAHVAGDVVVLDEVDVRNDRIDLLARLKIARGTPQGDLYARWGVLGVAAELDGGERRLHTIGAKRWYESRPGFARGE